ncbi:hypothetical protein [Methylobrevis albus]|uniref:Secreted protein n=1 Tax=Methylobrevis albus TaxID=2793297 RepID=A0A931MXM0_9HYPH|nr:hypothetical protein [Methylobrevis albus]MBH0237337.1 hypothetical protein [Methylobrevis albus]
MRNASKGRGRVRSLAPATLLSAIVMTCSIAVVSDAMAAETCKRIRGPESVAGLASVLPPNLNVEAFCRSSGCYFMLNSENNVYSTYGQNISVCFRTKKLVRAYDNPRCNLVSRVVYVSIDSDRKPRGDKFDVIYSENPNDDAEECFEAEMPQMDPEDGRFISVGFYGHARLTIFRYD